MPTIHKKLEAADQALQKSAKFAEVAKPKLERLEKMETEFRKKADRVAGELTQAGYIPSYEADKLVDKLAEDPVKALDLVTKIANMAATEDLGGPSEVKDAETVDYDPYERFALFGDSRSIGREHSGFID